MGLIEDDGVVIGQHVAAGGDIGEVERVVRDHELRLGGAPACGLGKAARKERAAAARAPVGADGELGPEGFRRLERELGAVSGLRLRDPGPERLVGLLVARVAQEHRPEALELAAAEVVLAALENGDRDLAPERASSGGHVLGEELFLQCLRRGRDDDRAARGERRKEVGEALARPGAGLGDQMLSARERLGHCRRQRSLLGPGLEAGKGCRKSAAGGEDIAHACKGTGSERLFPPNPPIATHVPRYLPNGSMEAQKNQPRQVRRPTGAECRIQRARRPTGSDVREAIW